MNNKIYISYLLTTYNKLNYLTVTLPYNISQLLTNEEIIIYDGESSDGSVEYIREFIKDKNNILFFSEKDLGESHGLNKCILSANGKYLKIISDDDLYHFPTIRKACQWMDEHEDCDWMGSNGFSYSFNNKQENFILKNEEPYYQKFKKDKKPFLLTGLGYLIRRKSVSKLGLFNTNYKIVDFEYSLRNLSNSKIKFALCLLPFYVNIVNPNSNSIKFQKTLIKEYVKLQKLYNAVSVLNVMIWYIRQEFMYNYHLLKKNKVIQNDFDFNHIYMQLADKLNAYNSKNPFKILYG